MNIGDKVKVYSVGGYVRRYFPGVIVHVTKGGKVDVEIQFQNIKSKMRFSAEGTGVGEAKGSYRISHD